MTSRAQKLTGRSRPRRRHAKGQPVSRFWSITPPSRSQSTADMSLLGTITEARCKFIARDSAGAVVGEFPTITLAARSLPEQLKDGAMPGAPNKKSGKSQDINHDSCDSVER